MEARSKTVEDWFAMIREGQITLPRLLYANPKLHGCPEKLTQDAECD